MACKALVCAYAGRGLPRTLWKPGPVPASPLALKVYAFGTEVLFSLSMPLWGTFKRKFPPVQQTPDLRSSVTMFALCLKLLKRKKMFSMDLWKQKHWFVLFGVCHSFSDNSMFSGALGGPSFLQIRLVPGESGKFVSCIPPTLCSLSNAHLQWSQCPMGLTTDYPKEGSNLALIDSNYEELMDHNSFWIFVF